MNINFKDFIALSYREKCQDVHKQCRREHLRDRVQCVMRGGHKHSKKGGGGGGRGKVKHGCESNTILHHKKKFQNEYLNMILYSFPFCFGSKFIECINYIRSFHSFVFC